MPYLKIQTNLPVSRAAETAVVNEVTALIARDLHTPPEAVVIAIECDARLFLAGTDDPAAFVEMKSKQLPPQGRAFGEALADAVHRHLGIPAARVYVKFISASGMWSNEPNG
jgi:phenylpyruvate tautomerase